MIVDGVLIEREDEVPKLVRKQLKDGHVARFPLAASRRNSIERASPGSAALPIATSSALARSS